jgi:predicted transcriptional regulator
VINLENVTSIGDKIRQLRQKLRLSQEQLALNAGVNTSYIGNPNKDILVRDDLIVDSMVIFPHIAKVGLLM